MFYEVGWETTNILGSGSDYHVTYQGTSEDEAMEEFHKPGNTYMSRVVRDLIGTHHEWYNPLTKEWEFWY